MILPDKNIKPKYSFLGCGAIMLEKLSTPQTVSSLWEKVKDSKEIGGYENFILVLDFLYAIGIIELKENLIRIIKND